MPIETIITLTLCALASYGLSHWYRVTAARRSILAEINERSAHTDPTPTGGGVGFVMAFALGLLSLWLQGWVSNTIALAMLGPLGVSLVGFVDDLNPLTWVTRVPMYLAGCIWVIYFVGFPTLNIGGVEIDLGIVGLVFGVVSLIWLQNLYNFMDGIDGIASSEAAFVCISVILIGGDGSLGGWNGIAMLLAAVSLGFAVINWPAARIFMGDVGSSFLGLTLGTLALAHAGVSVWVWMILLGWFLTDGCLTISVRLLRRERIYESHNLHAYQHLARQFGVRKTLYGVLAVNVVWLLPLAFLAHAFPDVAAVLLILASIPLVICQFLCGAGQTHPGISLVNNEQQ